MKTAIAPHELIPEGLCLEGLSIGDGVASTPRDCHARQAQRPAR